MPNRHASYMLDAMWMYVCSLPAENVLLSGVQWAATRQARFIADHAYCNCRMESLYAACRDTGTGSTPWPYPQSMH